MLFPMLLQHKSTSPDTTGSYLSVRQLAARLGVSPQTIRNWTKARAISPVLKRGRVIRYEWQQVARDLGIGNRSTLHPAFEEVPQ